MHACHEIVLCKHLAPCASWKYEHIILYQNKAALLNCQKYLHRKAENLKRCSAQGASDSAMFNGDILISTTLVKHIIARPQGKPAKGSRVIHVCREQVCQH